MEGEAEILALLVMCANLITMNPTSSTSAGKFGFSD